MQQEQVQVGMQLFYCTPPITCFKPTGVTVSNITATTASVSWTESVVQRKMAGFSVASWF